MSTKQPLLLKFCSTQQELMLVFGQTEEDERGQMEAVGQTDVEVEIVI